MPKPNINDALNFLSKFTLRRAWNAGKVPEAKKLFEQAVQADPKLADAHYWLGMATVNEGNLPESAKHFEEYLKLAPTGQYAEQAKSILASIKK